MGCAPTSCRSIKFGLFTLAVVFIFNPLIAVLDLLPDAIGYLVLCIALTRLADLYPQLAEARQKFWRMAGIDAAKLLSNLWMITMVVDHELPNTRLLLTFVFAVLEFIYAIPAWSALFEGLYAMILTDGELARYLPPVRRRRRTEKTMPELCGRATVAFFIWRNVLAVLPELSSLSYAAFENSGYVTNADRNIYDFRGLFLVVAIFLMCIVGVIWLVRTLRFTARLASDKALSVRVTERYTAEIIPREKLFVRRNLRFSLKLLVPAAICSIDLYLDGVNILPDILGAFFIIWALLRLRRCLGGWQLPLALSALWGILSVGTAYLNFRFYDQYYIELIYRKPDAYYAYGNLAVSTLLTQFAFLAALLSLGWYLYRISRHYLQSSGRENREILAEHRVKLIGFGILVLLSALGGVGYVFLQLRVEFIWLLDFALALILAIDVWKMMSEISEDILRAVGEDEFDDKTRTDVHTYVR